MQASDQELLSAAAQGDDAAFHALVDRHSKGLFRMALSLSHNRADAEDLLQETFVGAYRGLRKFDGRASVKTWLISILTRQAAKGWHRGRHHRATISIHAASGDSERQDAALTSAPATTSVESRIDVLQILQALDRPHREVLIMREMQGMTYDEMARALGVPRGTVESRLHRARAEFRRRVQGSP